MAMMFDGIAARTVIWSRTVLLDLWDGEVVGPCDSVVAQKCYMVVWIATRGEVMWLC